MTREECFFFLLAVQQRFYITLKPFRQVDAQKTPSSDDHAQHAHIFKLYQTTAKLIIKLAARTTPIGVTVTVKL